MTGRPDRRRRGLTPGSERLALEFIARQPASAARILERNPVEHSLSLLRALPVDELVELLQRMNPGHARRCLEALPVERVSDLLRRLSSVDAAAILRSLGSSRRNALLRRLPQRVSLPLGWLLRQPEHSVGAWTDLRAVTLTSDLSAEEARLRLRKDATTDDAIYVLDRDRRLRGVVGAAALLTADPSTQVSDLMDAPPAPLPSLAGLASAATLPGWQRHRVLPVVDGHQRFVGVLRHPDLKRGLRRGEEAPARLSVTDALVEAGEAYWIGLSGLLRASLAVLAPPLQPERRSDPP